MKKVINISSLVLHGALLILYIWFIYIVSTMFSFVPWYDENAMYLIDMIYLWLPLSCVTILMLITRFITKTFDYFYVCISALNAVYIPILFVLGFVDHPFLLTAFIAVAACVTMVLYSVAYIKGVIRQRHNLFG